MSAASVSATASSGASLPPELVPILLVVAVAVASAVEKLDDKLFNAVVETLEGTSGCGPSAVLQWPLTLAVRVQLALRAAGDPAAELLGRQIDGALECVAHRVLLVE